MIRTELKRGTAELAILSVKEKEPLHGYEIARQIAEQSKGALRFTLAALYPMLYRLDNRSRLTKGGLGDRRERPSAQMLPPYAAWAKDA